MKKVDIIALLLWCSLACFCLIYVNLWFALAALVLFGAACVVKLFDR